MMGRILGISALTVVSVCMLAAQTAPPPKLEQKIIIVGNNQEWFSSGYTLRAGDQVTIKAMGRVYFNSSEGSSVGPNGFQGNYRGEWAEDASACEDPLPKESHACLIAKINDEKFKIGSSAKFSGKSGELLLGINDCSRTGKLGNTGVFGANIKLERDAVPVKK